MTAVEDRIRLAARDFDQRCAALALLTLVLWLCVGVACAHDLAGNPNWIADGHYTSPVDGPHCCGLADCAVVEIDALVPHREVQPSKDGRYWRCRRPSGERRCFFAPPPGS